MPKIVIPEIQEALGTSLGRAGAFAAIIRYVAFSGRLVLNIPERITPSIHIDLGVIQTSVSSMAL